MINIKSTLIIFTAIFCSQILQAQQWILQPSGSSQQLNSVSFTNTNTGWAVGNSGIILNTVNGGITWNAQNGAAVIDLNSVFFIRGTLTGWAVGAQGFIESTTNGGLDWVIQQNSITNLTLYSVNFMNGIAYASGFETDLGPAIEKTTNGGQTWLKVNYDLPAANIFYSIQFPSGSSGWIVTGGGRIYETQNGFILNPQTSGTTSALYSAFFADNFTGYITGANGVILKTSNGSTWVMQQSFTNANLRSVNFLNSLTGWIVGSGGTLLKTLNGGINWIGQNSGLTVELRSVTFINDSTGWAVGDSGKIISTRIHSVTGIVPVNSSVPSVYSLSQNYPNPFNPSTVIKYDLSTSGIVSLKVFNVTGQQMAVLENGFKNAGTYEVHFNSENLPSGVYFYTIKTNDFTDTKKMLMVK